MDGDTRGDPWRANGSSPLVVDEPGDEVQVARLRHVDVGEVAGDDDDPAAGALHQLRVLVRLGLVGVDRPEHGRVEGMGGLEHDHRTMGHGLDDRALDRDALRGLDQCDSRCGRIGAGAHRGDYVAEEAERREGWAGSCTTTIPAVSGTPGGTTGADPRRPGAPAGDDLVDAVALPADAGRQHHDDAVAHRPQAWHDVVDERHDRAPGRTASWHRSGCRSPAATIRSPGLARDRVMTTRGVGMGIGTRNDRPAVAVLGLLGEHLVREVPREQDRVIRTFLEELVLPARSGSRYRE